MCLLCALFLVARQFKNPCDKKIEETVHPYRDPTLEPGLGCLGLSPCGQARHSQKNMGPPSCRSNTHRRCHRGWVQCLLGGSHGETNPLLPRSQLGHGKSLSECLERILGTSCVVFRGETQDTPERLYLLAAVWISWFSPGQARGGCRDVWAPMLLPPQPCPV